MLYRDFPSKTEPPIIEDVREVAEGIWSSDPDAYISFESYAGYGQTINETPNVVRIFTDGLIAQATKKTIIKNDVKVLTQVITVPSFGYGCYKYNDDLNINTRVRRRVAIDPEAGEQPDDSIPWSLAYAYDPVYNALLSILFRLGNDYVTRENAIPGSAQEGDSEIFGLQGTPWEALLSDAGIEGCSVNSERVGGQFDGYTTYTIEFPELEDGESEPGLIELRSSESFVSRVASLQLAGGGLDYSLIFGIDNSSTGRLGTEYGLLMDDYKGLDEPVLVQEADPNPRFGNPTPNYWEIPIKKANKEMVRLRPVITHGTIVFSGPQEYISKVSVSYECEEGSRTPTVNTTEPEIADDGLSYRFVRETTGGVRSDDAEGCEAQEPVITKTSLAPTIKTVHNNMVAKFEEKRYVLGSGVSGNSQYFGGQGFEVDKVPFDWPSPGSEIVVPGNPDDPYDSGSITYKKSYFFAHLPMNSPILKWDYVVHEATSEGQLYFGEFIPTNNHKIVTLDFTNAEQVAVTFAANDRSDDPNYNPDDDPLSGLEFQENALFLDCTEAMDQSDRSEISWLYYFPSKPEYGPPVEGEEEEEPYVVTSGMYAYYSNAWSILPFPTDFGSVNDYMLPENEVKGLGGKKLWPDDLPKWHETTETFVIEVEGEEVGA